MDAYTKETLFAEHTLSNKKRLIFSIIFILTLALAGIISYFIMESRREPGVAVKVYYENDVIAEYPLSLDREYILNDGTNVLVIEGGKAYMKYADCPDGVCKHQGRISKSGERIVCLPNKIMIEVSGEGEEIFPN